MSRDEYVELSLKTKMIKRQKLKINLVVQGEVL